MNVYGNLTSFVMVLSLAVKVMACMSVVFTTNWNSAS